MRILSASLLAVAVVVLLPALAHACPVCFSGTENRPAYFISFILLTALPLLTIGGILYWLVRRFQKAARDET